MNENPNNENRQEYDRIQAEADAQEDHTSMVESRRLAAAQATHGIWADLSDDAFAELTGDGIMDQPKVTDFTEILPMVAEPGKFVLCVKLDSGASIVVATGLVIEEAERKELAINQAMIEFRTKRNAWDANLGQRR